MTAAAVMHTSSASAAALGPGEHAERAQETAVLEEIQVGETKQHIGKPSPFSRLRGVCARGVRPYAAHSLPNRNTRRRRASTARVLLTKILCDWK